MKELMKKAHEMTKEIKKEFPEVDYKFQLGLCMSYLLNEKKEEIMDKFEILENKVKAIQEERAYRTYSVSRKFWKKEIKKGDEVITLERTYFNIYIQRHDFSCYIDNSTQTLKDYEGGLTSICKQFRREVISFMKENIKELMLEK